MVPVNNSLEAHKKIPLFIILLLCCFHQNAIAQDTLSVAEPEKHIFKADPMRATMLALAFPGLGQIYNRKYWKVPFVYAGFGGVIFALSYNSTNYNRFMKAYQDFTDDIPETDSYIEIIRNVDPSTYDPVLHPDTYDPSSASWYKDRMLRQVDYFKKYRDLSYIGFAAWYLFTVLDASVDASLFNYDISDKLELEIKPVKAPIMSAYAGFGLNMCLTLTF